jgi:hypothetical protein
MVLVILVMPLQLTDITNVIRYLRFGPMGPLQFRTNGQLNCIDLLYSSDQRRPSTPKIIPITETTISEAKMRTQVRFNILTDNSII